MNGGGGPELVDGETEGLSFVDLFADLAIINENLDGQW